MGLALSDASSRWEEKEAKSSIFTETIEKNLQVLV